MSELYPSMLDGIGFNQRTPLASWIHWTSGRHWEGLHIPCRALSFETWLRSSDWQIPGKKERLEAEDCIWKWKLCPPHTIFWIRGLPLFLSLPPVSISCQVCLCSLPRYSHSNRNCVTNNNSTSSCISGSSAVPRNGSKIYGDINFPTNLWEVYIK